MRSTHTPASISKNRSSGIQAAAGFLFRRQGRLESRRPTNCLGTAEILYSVAIASCVQNAGENQQATRQLPACSVCVETTHRKKELKFSSERLWDHERSVGLEPEGSGFECWVHQWLWKIEQVSFEVCCSHLSNGSLDIPIWLQA